MKKRYETFCGCHVANNEIVFCAIHGKVQQMVNVLDMLRRYFIDTFPKGDGGEDSPFGREIDKVLPRRGGV